MGHLLGRAVMAKAWSRASCRNMETDVIATGGLAPLFTDATDCIKRADLDLTLRGLLSLYRRNAPKNP